MATLPAHVDGVPDALLVPDAHLAEGARELQALLAAPAVEAPPAPSGSVSLTQPAAGGRVETASVASMGVRVSVVIPTLNEEQNLPYVFARLPEGLHEVIVVDGNSIDHTVAIARRLRPDVRVVMQTGRGKGNALATGFYECTGDIIVTLDADGSTDAREIPRFVAALCHGADFVKGSRFAQGGASADITPVRKLGNRALGALVNALYRTSYTDLCYGYNAFWASCLPYMRVDCDGFEVETLINIRIAKAGLIVHEVPSYERSRIHGISNLSAVRDGGRVLRTIALERSPAARQFWRAHLQRHAPLP
jgi:glycosyltransferase involved in cell wall biosynthesis